MVRIYSNTPYIPRGMSHSLYLDVGTFSGGVASTQFLLDKLCLFQCLPINSTNVLLPHEEGEEWLGMCCHLPEVLRGGALRRNTIFLIQSLCQFPCWLLLCFWKSAPRLREDLTVTLPVPRQKEGLGTMPLSNSYRKPLKLELNWNVS